MTFWMLKQLLTSTEQTLALVTCGLRGPGRPAHPSTDSTLPELHPFSSPSPSTLPMRGSSPWFSASSCRKLLLDIVSAPGKIEEDHQSLRHKA